MATIRGTSGNDRLKSSGRTGEVDEIFGLDGDDYLEGGFQPDCFIYGGAGNDMMVAALGEAKFVL